MNTTRQSLVYDTDVMLPTKTHTSTLRMANFIPKHANEGRRADLDTINEIRDQAQIRSEATKRRVGAR